MNSHFTIYTVSWVLYCLLALVMFLRDRRSYAVARREDTGGTSSNHGRSSPFSLRPYPSWSWLPTRAIRRVSSTQVSCPCSPSRAPPSPWGRCRMVTGRLPVGQLVVISAVWMFSASWCYDIYIFLRDGSYPVTWSSNITASSLLYFLAGLLWNLDWKKGKGVILSFGKRHWPYASREGYSAGSSGSRFP